jgi:hypothetical protein
MTTTTRPARKWSTASMTARLKRPVLRAPWQLQEPWCGVDIAGLAYPLECQCQMGRQSTPRFSSSSSIPPS